MAGDVYKPNAYNSTLAIIRGSILVAAIAAIRHLISIEVMF